MELRWVKTCGLNASPQSSLCLSTSLWHFDLFPSAWCPLKILDYESLIQASSHQYVCVLFTSSESSSSLSLSYKSFILIVFPRICATSLNSSCCEG
eukprot:m.101244 g.101244  ORF g.101244 m.101244 type:complete len:96 (-) comp12573_c1_seq1:326-613(-)